MVEPIDPPQNVTAFRPRIFTPPKPKTQEDIKAEQAAMAEALIRDLAQQGKEPLK